jgi:hypothetical protein
MTLVRISPDGSEVKHLYNDDIIRITAETSDITVKRASDVFFDNDIKKWRIRLVDTEEVIGVEFDKRAEAIAYEIEMLENLMKAGL